ncbi:hypothetical protein [Polaribacter sp. BAL334]|uniref:hypothetical protein n=1 Tax=Polaribacter sp. BAL334 TaxID=1708178 RepID=UPI003979371A
MCNTPVSASISYSNGIRGKAVTSMEAELGKKVDLEDVKSKILNHFKVLFEVEDWV